MSNDILNNSYVIGVGTKNLILSTLGRVWVKTKDKYTEIEFTSGGVTSTSPDVIPNIHVVNTKVDALSLSYPGDNQIIISLDGTLFVTIDGKIVEWKPEKSSQDITLDNLTINGVLTVNNLDGTSLILNHNPNLPAFIINGNELINNLNAQFLNGFGSDEFAIKNQDENITGTWNFNDLNINGVISGGNTIIDFSSNTLEVDYLIVRNKIIDPESITNLKLFGTNDETWISKELYVASNDESSVSSINPISVIDFAVRTGYLNNNPFDWELFESESELLEFWYNIFISDMGQDDEIAYIPPTIRDLKDPSEILYVNNILSSNSFRLIHNYMEVYYSLYDGDILNKFNGITYNLYLRESLDNYNYVTVNSVIKSHRNWYKVLDVNENIIIVKSLSNDLKSDEVKFTMVGHLTDPNKKGNIQFNSINNYPSYIDITTDYEYDSIIENEEFGIGYTTKLNNNDNIKIRIGNLNGLAEDDVFGEFENQFGIFGNGNINTSLEETEDINDISDFAKTNKNGLYLKNPTFSFNKVSILNPDGSGYLSNGKLLWTKDNLLVQNSKFKNVNIEESTIDQQTFDNSNLQAGGDLEGTYPNPTVKKLQEILDRLNAIETKLDNIEDEITNINNKIEDIDNRMNNFSEELNGINTKIENITSNVDNLQLFTEEAISDIRTDIQNLDSRVTALET